MKFSLDLKFEFKKSFKLYCQTLVKVITKLAKIMSIFYSMDERKRNSVNI